MVDIFLIQRDKNTSLQIQDILKRNGYGVICANTYADSIIRLTTEIFQIVAIDLDIDKNYEKIKDLIQRAKSIKTNTSVIVLSSSHTCEILNKCLDDGAEDYITGKIEEKIFILRIERLLKIQKLETAVANSIDYDNNDQRWTSLFNIMPAMAIIANEKSQIIDVNKAALTKFAKTMEQALELCVGAFVNCKHSVDNNNVCPRDQRCDGCFLRSAISDAAKKNIPTINKIGSFTQIKNGNNRKKTFKISVAPLIYNDTKAVIINILDITAEQKNIDELTKNLENLQKSYNQSVDNEKLASKISENLTSLNEYLNEQSNKYHMLFNNMTSGFLLLKKSKDKENRPLIEVVEGNEKIYNILNINHNIQYVGKSIFDIAPKLSTAFKQKLMQTFETGNPTTLEIKSEQFGKYFSINFYVPMGDYTALIINDITEKKEIEKNAKEMNTRLKKQNILLDDQRERLALVLEGSRDGIWDYQFDKDDLFFSKAYKKQLGYEPDEIDPKNKEQIIKFFYQEDLPLFYKKQKEVLSGQCDDIEEEIRMICKDGTPKWFKVRAIVRRNVEGKAIRIAGVNTDITQRKKSEAVIKNKNEQLQKAINTKNMFISIIAHDLKNPFNAILGLSEMLLRRMKTNENADKRNVEMVSLINQSAKSTFEMLNNLLIWARSQQNTIKFEPVILNLHDVADETVKEVKGQAEKKHITVINNISGKQEVFADKQMLQTIIRNLTGNSIKFTNEGGLIILSSKEDQNNVTVIVEDNGVGMTKETMSQLMLVNKNKSTNGTQGETGTGMGLLICKEFIDKHHGNVTIESEVEKGSKFFISFPKNNAEN